MLPGPTGDFGFVGEEKWRGVKFSGVPWLSERFREFRSVLWESDEFREREPKDEKKLDLNLGSPQ